MLISISVATSVCMIFRTFTCTSCCTKIAIPAPLEMLIFASFFPIIIDKMDFLTALKDHPEAIFSLSKNSDAVDKINRITKSLLDPIAKDHSVLDEIYIDGLDATQVFGQAKMILLGVGESLLFTKIPELKEKYGVASDEEGDDLDANAGSGSENADESEEFFLMDEPEASEGEEDLEQEELEQEVEDEEEGFGGFSGDEDDEEEDHALDSDETKVESDREEIKKDVFGLNDEFFDIDDFNKQIIALEDEDNDDDENINLFDDLSADEESEGEMDYYDEFFDKPGQKKVIKATKVEEEVEEEEEPSDLEDNEYDQAVDSAMHDLFADEEKPQAKLSTFEKQQQQLQAEIAKLEAELVAEKKWTMKGEVRSRDRPVDSLLDDEETPSLEFDRTSKPVPVITAEVTESIEDLIKRRVRNDEFDDLPKRLVTDVGKYAQRKKTEVSDQKSSKSLAEIYEDEYHGVDPELKITDEIQAEHDEISDLFTKLSYKLDLLCLAHYIPKPHQFKTIDIKVTDAASIAMEDAQPLHVSEDAVLAPQEVYKIGDDKAKADGARGVSEVQLKSGLAYSKDELSRDDKQRLRRSKKRAKSKHFNELNEARGKEEKGGEKKRQKVGEVMDTLSKAKNVTVIDRKGQLRDALGKMKKAEAAHTGSRFRL